MRGVFWSLRRSALIAVAVGSVAGAAAMTWMLQVGQLSTPQLLVILALLILPGATFGAWWLDRRHRRETLGDSDDLFETPEGVEVVDDEPDAPTRPEPESRDGRRLHEAHRRRAGERMSRRG